jgi:hypothetical protein
MLGARLEVNDGLGSRVIPIDKPVLAIAVTSRVTTRKSQLPTALTSFGTKDRATARSSTANRLPSVRYAMAIGCSLVARREPMLFF